jgi:hypothetical protein
MRKGCRAGKSISTDKKHAKRDAFKKGLSRTGKQKSTHVSYLFCLPGKEKMLAAI